MLFTNLKEEEKIRSLIYVTNHDVGKLSSDKTIEKKQWEMLDVLWKYYIKECDYKFIVNKMKTDKYNIVYTFIWPDKMTLTELDLLLGEFVYRTEQYKKIMLSLNECKGRQTLAQQKFISNFIEYFDDWFTYDVEDFVSIYNNKYYLDNLVASKDMMRLLY